MRKIITVLLALVMALALLPATIWAGDEDGNTKAVAMIGDQGYDTLEAAFAAVKKGETIKLMENTHGNGIVVKSGSEFTVDFNNCTYTMDGALVGSTGTETQAFQLLKDSTITFKNGTITSDKAKLLIQNYSNLTLDNMTLTAGETCAYVLSNNNGNVVINDTTITPAEGKFAFDVCRFASYDGPTVTVKGDSAINGKIEVSKASGAKENSTCALNIESGTFAGAIEVVGEVPNFTPNITGGTFAVAPKGLINTTDEIVENDDGTFTVGKITPDAKIGDVNYNSLAEAIGAAKDGDTVTLLKNVTVDDYLEIKKAITLDLGGKRLSSLGGGLDVYADLTVKNGSMKTLKWAAWVQDGAALVVEKDVSITTTSTNSSHGGITVAGDGSSVTMFGKVQSVGTAISGIGNKDDGGVTINIEEGAVLTSTNGVGIYYPNTATLNIKGGTITGLTGVYVKSGKTVVTGGTIIGTGAKADYEYYGNGCNSTGDAFVVDKCNYPGGDPVVEIKGGTFKSEKANAVASYVGNNAANALTGFISGGTFSSDPSALAAEGFVATKDTEGAFTVAKPAPTPEKPEDKPTEGKGDAPKTYDAGIAIYGMTAILSASGMAWMGLKKRK